MTEVCELEIKVIPNASRDAVVGWYGDVLKIKTAVAPEAGKANKAVCALLAKHLGVPKRAVSVVRGQTSPVKRLHIEGMNEALLKERV